MQRMQCFIFMVCWVKKGSTSWVARAGRAPRRGGIRRVQFTGIIFTRSII